MNTPIACGLKTIDSIMLTPLVRTALRQDDIVVIDWKYDTLQGGSFNPKYIVSRGAPIAAQKFSLGH